MIQNELLDKCEAQLKDLIERLPKAVEGLTDEQFNTPAPGGPWSIAGIIDHMNIAAGPYFVAAAPLVKNGPRNSGSAVKNTFFGGMITKAAGPNGNAPAAGNMAPSKATYDKAVLHEWLTIHNQILELVTDARTADLNQKFKNPFVGFLKMNLVDFFTIMSEHAERHVRQIEERKPAVLNQAS